MAFLTEIPLPVETIARSRDVSGGTKMFAQWGFHCRIGMAARTSSSSSDDVLSEDSDSNALNLYDSDGNNSEPFVESGPRPYQYESRRIPRNDPHEDSTEPVDSDDDRLGNSDWYLIHCVIYLYLA